MLPLLQVMLSSPITHTPLHAKNVDANTPSAHTNTHTHTHTHTGMNGIQEGGGDVNGGSVIQLD